MPFMHDWGRGSSWGFGFPVFPSFLLLLILWSLTWKGLALWHAARRGERWWFIILLVVNTAGILEIVYLFTQARLTFKTLFKNERDR